MVITDLILFSKLLCAVFEMMQRSRFKFKSVEFNTTIIYVIFNTLNSLNALMALHRQFVPWRCRINYISVSLTVQQFKDSWIHFIQLFIFHWFWFNSSYFIQQSSRKNWNQLTNSSSPSKFQVFQYFWALFQFENFIGSKLKKIVENLSITWFRLLS